MTKKFLLIVFSAFFACAVFSALAVSVPTASPDIPPSSADDFSKYYGLSSSASGWGFKKNKGSAPDIPKKTTELLKKYNAVYMGSPDEKTLYLTFDEGYENGYTAQILDVLKKTETPAAFFVTGPYLKKETELIQRMLDEGHIVGNHTVNHPNLAKCTPEKAASEIRELADVFKEAYGQDMRYMRPPEGEYSEQVLALACDMGYRTVFWSFAYKDWDVKIQKGADYAFNSTVPYLHSGAVILLHAVSKDNAAALERIINSAKEQGFVFKSLDCLP